MTCPLPISVHHDAGWRQMLMTSGMKKRMAMKREGMLAACPSKALAVATASSTATLVPVT